MVSTRRNLQSAWRKKKIRVGKKRTPKGMSVVQKLLKHYSLEIALDTPKGE